MDANIADEALNPDLTDDSFKLCGKTIKIKPLKLKYQMVFAKKLSQVLKGTAYHIQEQEWASVLAEITEKPEIVPEVIQLIAENDGHTLTLDEIGDQADMGMDELLKVIIRVLMKSQTIGAPVVDFFTKAWPKIKANAVARAKVMELQLDQELIHLTDTLSQASASDSTGHSAMSSS